MSSLWASKICILTSVGIGIPLHPKYSTNESAGTRKHMKGALSCRHSGSSSEAQELISSFSDMWARRARLGALLRFRQPWFARNRKS